MPYSRYGTLDEQSIANTMSAFRGDVPAITVKMKRM